MAFEFNRLVDVEALSEVPEGASVFAEVNGAVKRVPGEGLGGAGGIKTAIIKDSGYDNMVSGIAPAASASPQYTYECLNMSFDEAFSAIASGEPFAAFVMETRSNGVQSYYTQWEISYDTSVPCIIIYANFDLYWTADGVSTEPPAEPK